MKKSMLLALAVLFSTSCDANQNQNLNQNRNYIPNYHIKCTENGYDIADEDVDDFHIGNWYITWTDSYGKKHRVFSTSCRIDDL